MGLFDRFAGTVVGTVAGKVSGAFAPRRSTAGTASATPPETRASRTRTALALGAGRPVWTPRDYAALAREGYLRNPVVYRCVRMIAESAACVPWLLREGDAEHVAHPLLDLLAQPNPQAGGAAFLESLYGHLLVSGNAYVEAVTVAGEGRPGLLPPAPRELHVLRPDRMKVVPGADGWPEGFEYSVGGRTVRFPSASRPHASSLSGAAVDPVLHMTLFHPLDDHYGFAPTEAAQVSLDIHNAAGAWNKALLDNAARPSGALVYAAGGGGNLTDEQFERLKGELEDGYQGARNAGRPLLLEGGLDWKPMGITPKDMDFINAKNQAAREIALAFGVPPMLIGIPGDNTYSNYQEANRAFWRQSVLPLIGRTARALTNWLAPAFGADLRLAHDLDAIEALSVEREALWRRVGAADFLTDDEKREALGYAPRGEAAGVPHVSDPNVSAHETSGPQMSGRQDADR